MAEGGSAENSDVVGAYFDIYMSTKEKMDIKTSSQGSTNTWDISDSFLQSRGPSQLNRQLHSQLQIGRCEVRVFLSRWGSSDATS